MGNKQLTAVEVAPEDMGVGKTFAFYKGIANARYPTAIRDFNSFVKYEKPFVYYTACNDTALQVLEWDESLWIRKWVKK